MERPLAQSQQGTQIAACRKNATARGTCCCDIISFACDNISFVLPPADSFKPRDPNEPLDPSRFRGSCGPSFDAGPRPACDVDGPRFGQKSDGPANCAKPAASSAEQYRRH